MAYSKKIYNEAMDIIRGRRLNAEKEAEQRRERIFRTDPETEKISREISSCGVQAAKAVLMGSDVKQELEALKNKNLTLQKALKDRLIALGYTPDALEPRYFCPVCGDTGYYEDNNKTLVCSCLKKALIRCSCDELNSVSPLSLCTFSSFSLDCYDMDVEDNTGSSYEKMSRVYNFCRKYADSFSCGSGNIFMRGATGLGKTHLSLAIANEVISKGFSVVYVSAPAILSRLEKEHFSGERSKEEEILSGLLECDLLIIDDLGTEFINNFSVTEIYNIFNSRLLTGKPVIINSNLTLKEIEKNYSQRFLSRLAGCAVRLDFTGRDARISGSENKNF